MTKKFELRPPSVFTPFLRRFTNQRENEKHELHQLYVTVSEAWKKSHWSHPYAVETFASLVLDELEARAPLPPESSQLRETLFAAISGSLALERHIFATPEYATPSLKAEVELGEFLRARQYFLAADERHGSLLLEAMVTAFLPLVEALPPVDATATLTTPLVDRVPNLPFIIEHFFAVMTARELVDAGLFVELFERYYRNACAFAGVPVGKDGHKLIPPTKANLAPPQLVATYCARTPLLQLFQTQVPFAIPRKTWASHGVILAPPNHGKTMLLGLMAADFLQTDTGFCVLDPHGDLFDTLRERVEPNRLMVLDPDTEPPALNFLDFGNSTQAETLQTFAYLMSSLSGGLSDKQGAIVPYLLKLLQLVPQASLETLRQLVDEKVKKAEQSSFAAFIAKMNVVDQGFFHNQFYSTRMQETKDAIGWKLYSALGSDAFRQMFSADRNSFDADAAMRERKIVLVKGARSALGDEGMSVFLQFIVSQFFSAALRRHRLPPDQRQLFMLFADEAHHIFNSQTSNILTECRKYGLGFVAATQVVQQIPDDVKAAIYGATAIKIAGPVSHSDAQVLAREMYCSGEFIRSMKAVERSHADFVFYVAGMTDRAVRVRVNYGMLEKMPKLTHQFVKKDIRETKQDAVPEPLPVVVAHKPIEPQQKNPPQGDGVSVQQTSTLTPPSVSHTDEDDDFFEKPMKGV